MSQPSRGDGGKIGLLEFLTVFRIGGTERQVVNLATAIDQSRFDLHLACFRKEGELLGEVEQCGARITEFRIPSLRSLTSLRKLVQLVRYLRRSRIRIVRTYGLYPNVFAVIAARIARVPIVLTSIRDTGDHLTSFERWVQRQVSRLADRVVTNAEAVRQRLIAEGYSSERLVVIHNGITLDAAERPAPGIREELGFPCAAPVIAVVSRLEVGKGIEHFLEAAAVLSARHPEARFLVVGDLAVVGPGKHAHRVRLERYAEELGLSDRVVFTGFRSDVRRVLSEVTISVLPSLSEGLSNAILESMAAGVPVVATAVGGNLELVEEGVTGLLVPPRDPKCLADAIGHLLADPELARRFGEAGRQRVVERFSLNAMVSATEKLYLGLLGDVGAVLEPTGRLVQPSAYRD